MNFNTYIQKLNEVMEKSKLENGYSHIVYQIFDITLDDNKYSIVDTSSLKRTQDSITAPKDVVAVPDFVITEKGYCYDDNQQDSDKVLGCIEVKYNDADIEKPDRLESTEIYRGYSEVYKKIIYTNGWIWTYYIGVKKQWQVVFEKDKNNTNNKTYGELLRYLCSIDWKE